MKNNKGFTLIELLAVLVILTAIMTIAIPSISSSLERNKAKQNASKIKILENAAELYVSDYKNLVYKNLNDKSKSECCITIQELIEHNLISDDAAITDSGSQFSGGIFFNKNNVSYTYKESECSNNKCVS